MSSIEATTVTPQPYKRLTPDERNTIIAKRLAGQDLNAIAAEFDISRVTVWRICNEMQQAVAKVNADWRNEQALLAVEAVNNGLRCDDDPYKQATVGVQALKGLGMYAPDQVNQVAVMLSNMPADMRAELEQTTEDKPV